MASNHGRTFDLAPARLRKYEAPRRGQKKTEMMSTVLRAVQETENKVVHIHGMPGSGKSQIVANTCQEMENKGYAVWYVQCQQGSENLILSWRDFARQLESISNEPGLSNAMSEALEVPEISKMKDVWTRMEHQGFQILLAVELEDADDPQSREACSSDIKILKSYVEAVSPCFHNVTLLIASRNEDILFVKSAHSDMECYKLYKVTGFTKSEAECFLESDVINYHRSDLSALAEELAYSPFGLLLAKSYCVEFRFTYGDYCNMLGKDVALVRKEKELLESHPDLGSHHRYEIIMKLLQPKDDTEYIEFTVMQMLSFLNKNSIPKQIIERFFQQVTPESQLDAKTSTIHLIRKLEKRVNGKWDSTDESDLISVHGDILRALQSSIEPLDKASILQNVLFSMSSILDKDNRLQNDYAILYLLKNHIAEVAVRCSRHFHQLGDNANIDIREYEIFLSLSRVNELIGYAISQHNCARENNEEDQYFEKAMKYLLLSLDISAQQSISEKEQFEDHSRNKDNIATVQPPRSVLGCIPGNIRDNLRQVIRYEENKDAKMTALKIFKIALNAINKNTLLNRALQNDYARNFPLKISDLDDFCDRGDKSQVELDHIKDDLSEKKKISDRHYQQLVKAEAVLHWNDLSKFYIVERMASILHSRGRQCIYARVMLDHVMILKCRWWVDLGFHLCDVAAEKTGFKSLFHFILRVNNILPRLCLNMPGETDNEFKDRIRHVKEILSQLNRDESLYYEHGKLRFVSGTPFANLRTSRYLIRVNTKMYKRPALLLEDYPTEDADRQARSLYKLAVDNPKIVIGTTCLVHVGKYWAARKMFEDSFDAFEKAFEIGIEEDSTKNPTRFAWALYNERRLMSTAPAKYVDDRLIRKVERRYQKAKTGDTPKFWLEMLSKIVYQVPTSDVSASAENGQTDAGCTPSGDLK